MPQAESAGCGAVHAHVSIIHRARVPLKRGQEEPFEKTQRALAVWRLNGASFEEEFATNAY